ncbi:hypothetical protein K492DRAFT_177529 [Lichtheimia hyalospora FSU 10163]|nr:hypothetical protein K492DRAFT_177529 [Lichtheimia hyalospora FSU 10163]
MPDSSTIDKSTSHASQDAQDNHSSTCTSFNSVFRIVTTAPGNQDDNDHNHHHPNDLTCQLNHLTLHEQSPFMPYIL